MSEPRKFLLLGLLLAVAAAARPAEAGEAAATTTISINNFYDPNTPEKATTRRLIDLMAEDPSIRITKWGGISLPGGAGKASLMMAIAGGTAPDIGEAWFHIIQNEIKQQFLSPLNEWICKDYDPKNPMAWDKNGNGQVDDDETAWEPWKQIPPLWRRVATVDGKVYALLQPSQYYLGVIYRTDLVQQAGLDPNRPPRTWAELKYWCQKLSNNRIGENGLVRQQRGIALQPAGFHFIPWIQAAGGEPILQVRRSPKTGAEYTFPPGADRFPTPDGEDLSTVEPEWRADFASEAGVAAAAFQHGLFHQPWMFDPETGEPVDLTPADIARREVEVGGRSVPVDPAAVFRGMGRVNVGNQRGQSPTELLARGEIAMTTAFVNDLSSFGTSLGLNPELLSWFPIPGRTEANLPVVQMQIHYIVAYEHVVRLPPEKRAAVWKTMTALADVKTRRNAVRERVLAGLARYVPPEELRRFGYDEYVADIPPNIVDNYVRIADGRIGIHTEPYMGYWLTMDQALSTQVLSLLMVHPDFDYRAALAEVTLRANSGVMFAPPRETLDRYRPWARVVFVLLAAGVGALCLLIVRAQLRDRVSGNQNTNANVHSRMIPYLLIFPALGLIALWKYYPLLRGMVMAFQDYRISGESKFTGLDNFIVLALDGSFWMSLLRTGYFVFLNMILAFTAPILLAVLLTEIPRFKILYRTIFFLPQMTSGLVIALMWKLMYNPTPDGFFNQIIQYLNLLPFVDIDPQTWLLDPKLAMICCVVPTVWASMGMASLIYLAALHSIPPDYYEAADLDGAGLWSKFRHITVPTILPLIIINFVGAFIGTFQHMGNIFLMTFGGPGEATTVTGLKIWIEAYNNLRFSMATSMAWVLGSLLIGFTYFQIRFLSRVEYRKSKFE